MLPLETFRKSLFIKSQDLTGELISLSLKVKIYIFN